MLFTYIIAVYYETHVKYKYTMWTKFSFSDESGGTVLNTVL
jgi:hypothetical protein